MTSIQENLMDKEMEHEMETEFIEWLIGIRDSENYGHLFVSGVPTIKSIIYWGLCLRVPLFWELTKSM